MISPLLLRVRRLLERETYGLRLLLQIGRQWARDKCPQQAASLAFQTTLGLVPLTAVGFAVLRATGALREQSALVEFLSRRILPVRGESIAASLLAFADNIRPGALGLPGIALTLLLLYVLFHNVESIWNDIWRVRERRTFWGKFPVFYTLATLLPAGLALSLYNTARFWRTGGLGLLISFGLTVAALALANRLLPRAPVKWRAAFAAAAVSAVLIELGKFAFSAYVSRLLLSRYEGIYGPLGVVPMLLTWIYVSWLAILFGAEVAYTVQNLERLELRKSVLPGQTDV